MTTRPSATRRKRRLRHDARDEILDAAAAALTERAFGDLSVDELMRRTGMTRSTFYHYFRGLSDVAVGLLERTKVEMVAAAEPTLDLDTSDDPIAGIQRGILDSATIFARHGPVLAAIHHAGSQHEDVERAWREGILAWFISRISTQLRTQRAAGLTRVEDPEEVVRALLLMNTTVFVERLGKRPPDSVEAVARTLSQIWIGALFPEVLVERRR
jgi:TetR/AcrR family transcriptional regulator, ethionamide resistance regulator